MNAMMRNFGDPFGMGPRMHPHMGNHALEGPRGLQRNRERQDLVPHHGFMNDMMGPMCLFSNMDSMFRDMHRGTVSQVLFYLKRESNFSESLFIFSRYL